MYFCFGLAGLAYFVPGIPELTRYSIMATGVVFGLYALNVDRFRDR
jgi:hypothetical protein